ncbi:MAG: hypothetical protein KY439_12500, partial [Actinobacteria bacterium]|nr:hypothetical protein [Actinomycetota bacterium]
MADTDVAAALHELGRRGHADAEVYALLGVGRSTLSDWRTGKHLPDTFREGPDGLTVIGRLERLAAD